MFVNNIRVICSILHRARQWYCHALYKMSKRLDDLIHELWANEISRDLSFRRISYVAQHHYLAYCESKLKWIWINKRQFSFQNMTLKVSTLENVIFCLGLHILSLEYIDCFIIWPTCMFERNMELIVCKNTIIYAIIINVPKLFLLPFFLFFFFFFSFLFFEQKKQLSWKHITTYPHFHNKQMSIAPWYGQAVASTIL